MLIFKRIITASISFLILFFAFYLGTMIIGGAIVGTAAGIKHPDNSQAAAEHAGEQFALNYFGAITLASVVLSGLVSGALAFGGILPWCRRKKHVRNEQKNNKKNTKPASRPPPSGDLLDE